MILFVYPQTHTHTHSGMDYQVWIEGAECTVSSLLDELYQKAGMSNMWSLVRHTAGMLHKRVEDLGAVSRAFVEDV